ncbi:MAG: glutathione peroxidase [Bacteroidetes bacterium]|nr:MAG: glutathione peroxidase [Bacteroidota bacterium]
MKIYILISIVAVIFGLGLIAWNSYAGIKIFQPSEGSVDFYSLSARTIDGKEFQFEQLRGKRVLIVNTASECGFTPQYKGLQKLHEMYGGDDFVILGFPCNDFGNQESGSSDEIVSFCSKNYGVEFQIMDKVKVKGEGVHPVYVWLENKNENGVSNNSIKWNFHKFLIDDTGHLVASVRSGVKPSDKLITKFASGKLK